jgi:hypothetical protein
MSSSRPSTRDELAQYCLRALGAPVIEINVDEDQIQDRIDEALQFYQEYHADAIVRTFVKHKITQEDFDTGIIQCSDEILSVVRVFNLASGPSADMFNVKYQMFLNDMYSLRNPGDLINYEITKQYLSLIEMTLTGMSQQIIYARHKNTLTIKNDWKGHLGVGSYIIIECYTTINPNQYPDVYNDMALKRYCIALIKRQWGLNLLKFEGMQLPGGVTLNGRAIYDDAKEEILKMEEEFDSKYGLPTDFFVG